MPLTLVTGPVRSGKSRFACNLAAESALPVTFVATARADVADAEWSARIARHRRERPEKWALVETAGPHGPDLAEVVAAAIDGVLVVDSLGTWLADRMSRALEVRGAGVPVDEDELDADATRLAGALLRARARVIAVGEETGWGIVPEHRSARIFRDVLGRMQQRLARGGERAYLVVAGIAIDLRAIGTPVA